MGAEGYSIISKTAHVLPAGGQQDNNFTVQPPTNPQDASPIRRPRLWLAPSSIRHSFHIQRFNTDKLRQVAVPRLKAAPSVGHKYRINGHAAFKRPTRL